VAGQTRIEIRTLKNANYPPESEPILSISCRLDTLDHFNTTPDGSLGMSAPHDVRHDGALVPPPVRHISSSYHRPFKGVPLSHFNTIRSDPIFTRKASVGPTCLSTVNFLHLTAFRLSNLSFIPVSHNLINMHNDACGKADELMNVRNVHIGSNRIMAFILYLTNKI
jgi:hypothetical protein